MSQIAFDPLTGNMISTTAQVAQGALAINLADRRLF